MYKLFGGRRIWGDMVSVQGQVSMMSADKTAVLTETQQEEVDRSGTGNQQCWWFSYELFQPEMSDVVLPGQKAAVSADAQPQAGSNMSAVGACEQLPPAQKGM